MATKISTVTVLLLLSTVTVFSTCKKPKDCNNSSYAFQIGVKAFPDLDSLNVGDTVFLEIDQPVVFQDLNSATSINFSNAINLGTNIGFQEIIGNAPQINNVANDFSIKLLKGIETRNSDPQLFREYLFIEENGKYGLKLGIIPKRSGIFRLNFGAAANVSRRDDVCSKASFKFNFFNTRQHFYLYPGGANTPAGGATYYFKVK